MLRFRIALLAAMALFVFRAGPRASRSRATLETAGPETRITNAALAFGAAAMLAMLPELNPHRPTRSGRTRACLRSR